MNRRQQQAESERARQRAVALGEAGDVRAVEELIELCRHPGPTVRRAAASALRKLAAHESTRESVPALCALARDSHPQVRHDDKFQIIKGYSVRPDFYLPAHDAYIEYWGLDTSDYRIGMLLKQKLYQQEGKKLISLYPADLSHLGAKLSSALEISHARGD